MQPDQVPVEAAYAAAMTRITRMSQALVLSEGARLVLTERVKQLEALTREQRDELGKLRDENERLLRAEENHFRPTNEGPPEWVCTYRGEVKSDAEDGEGADAHGEADTAQGFYD
jgi:hypothetical protein